MNTQKVMHVMQAQLQGQVLEAVQKYQSTAREENAQLESKITSTSQQHAVLLEGTQHLLMQKILDEKDSLEKNDI